MQQWIQSLQVALMISFLCFGHSSSLNVAVAQSINSPLFVAPPPPPGTGSPGQRSDAGSRPQSCRQAERSLTAIVPVYSSKDTDFVWGTTSAEQPTLWFYVPYTSQSASGEFVLENAANQQTVVKVPLAAKPGMMQVSLADLKLSLELNKPYRWYFNIYCANSDGVDGYVEGSITRQAIDPNVRDRLRQTQNLSQKVELLAANGLWYDALTFAADLHCGQANRAYWSNLLQSVGLQELTQHSIATCRNGAQ